MILGQSLWKNSPDGRILKSDIMIAKNYLDEKQIMLKGYFDGYLQNKKISEDQILMLVKSSDIQ